MAIGRLQLTAALALALASGDGPSDTREVLIVGRDYAFEMPATVAPGRSAFAFENRGKQPHEFNITLLKPSATTRDYIAAVNARQRVGPLVDRTVGVLFALPGKRSATRLVTDLLPGRTYVVICIFKDSGATQRHVTMGMFKELRVANGAATATTPIHADTVVAMDYAFQLPATLAPGRHWLAFVNRGKQRHEISIQLLKSGATLSRYARLATTGGDVDPLIDDGLGVLHAMGGVAPLGLLEVNLLPGREYVFECTFQDDDKAPTHDRLGMIGSVKVPRR